MPPLAPHISVSIPVLIMKEGRAFVAFTPALDISTTGNTLEKAQRRFQELVAIFFEELQEMGTLDAALKELGWSRSHSQWQPPSVISQSEVSFRIPALA